MAFPTYVYLEEARQAREARERDQNFLANTQTPGQGFAPESGQDDSSGSVGSQPLFGHDWLQRGEAPPARNWILTPEDAKAGAYYCGQPPSLLDRALFGVNYGEPAGSTGGYLKGYGQSGSGFGSTTGGYDEPYGSGWAFNTASGVTGSDGRR
jgi:hypothetical protein